jgi:Ca2+-binding EF-hand superfamily protein
MLATRFKNLNINNPLNDSNYKPKRSRNKNQKLSSQSSKDPIQERIKNKKPKPLTEKEKQLNAKINGLYNELEHVQSMLNEETITELWINFRECENKKNGRIPKKEFRRGAEQVFNQNLKYISWPYEKKKGVIDLLFERFNYFEKMKSIDIYDFLISMSILSRISNDEKIELILKLIDVDEDRCLSIGKFSTYHTLTTT